MKVLEEAFVDAPPAAAPWTFQETKDAALNKMYGDEARDLDVLGWGRS